MFDDLWNDEPTVRVPRERAADLVRANLRHRDHAPVPVRPADTSATAEYEIPPEFLAATI